jgi:TonB family protein
MVCNDAATDRRVDPDVCRALGVRSIVVVPIRGPVAIAGILEAFSTRPYAFSARQIDSLRALAEIVEAAYDGEHAQSPLPAGVALSTAPPNFAPPISADQILENRLSGVWPPKRRYLIPAVAAIALLLISMAVWLGWGGPEEIAAREASSPSVSAPKEPAGYTAPRDAPLYSSPRRQPDRSRSKDVLQNAAAIEPATDSVIPLTSDGKPSDLKSPEKPTIVSALLGSDSEPSPPPVDMSTSISPNELAGLSSTPAAMPAFGASVSQGVTEGSLIRKVDPTYPPEARAQGLAGSVTLDATIADDGTVHEVKTVSGSTLLAAAAAAAVRQWRYKPSLLNGKPIAIQKQITIVFKHP